MNMMHHALLCRIDSVQDFVLSTVDEGVEFYDEYIGRFGINDVRVLTEKAYSRPSEMTVQCLVTRTDFITLEAQNALLKIVEEPPVSTRFIFVLPSDFIILPTLASRLSNYQSTTHSDVKQDNVFSDFLSQSYSDRFAKIEKALKEKDIEWQQRIKRGLIRYIKQEADKPRLSELEYIARLLLTRGASNKMLLDNLALVLAIHTK